MPGPRKAGRRAGRTGSPRGASGPGRLQLGLRTDTADRAEPDVDGADLARVEGTGHPGRVVLDAAHAEGILVGEPFRAEEIHEDRRGLGMTPWAHLDLDVVLDQEMPVTEHV